VLAEQHDIPVVQVVAAHPVRLNINTVGAVQILDDAGVLGDDQLAVMATHEAAVDLHVVVGGAPDDQSPDTQRYLLHRATVGGDQQVPVSPGGGAPGRGAARCPILRA